jgi:hypothetical protein
MLRAQEVCVCVRGGEVAMPRAQEVCVCVRGGGGHATRSSSSARSATWRPRLLVAHIGGTLPQPHTYLNFHLCNRLSMQRLL